MGKFMKFGVVVAVMLCAAGAFASNFRVADQVYVAAIGHIASSRTFISDVFLTNVEDDAGNHSVLLTERDGVVKQVKKGQPLGCALTLAPDGGREIIDFVAAPYSQGGLNL